MGVCAERWPREHSLSRWWTPFNPDTNWQSERRVLQDQLSIDSNASTLLSPSDGGSGSDERRWYVGYGNSWRELGVSYSFCSLSATERFFVNLAADEANDDYTIDETDGLRSDVGVDDADEWEYEYPSDDHGVRSEPSATLSLADTDDGGVEGNVQGPRSAHKRSTRRSTCTCTSRSRGPWPRSLRCSCTIAKATTATTARCASLVSATTARRPYYFCDDTAVFALERNDALDAAYNLFSPSDTLLAGGALSSAVDLMVHMTESSLGVAFDLSFKSTPTTASPTQSFTGARSSSRRSPPGRSGSRWAWASSSTGRPTRSPTTSTLGLRRRGYLLGSTVEAPVHVVASSSRRLASPRRPRRSSRLRQCTADRDGSMTASP